MRHILFFFLLFFGFHSTAQNAKPKTSNAKLLSSLHIRNIGPAGMSGRVTAICADPVDDKTIYIGTASGGVWRSENKGTTWVPLFDEQPTQSIGCIAIHEKNPDVIWVGTGEGNPRNSQSFGRGMYKSIDRGKTWTFMGLEDSRTIHRVRLHRDNPEIAWAGVLGPAYGKQAQRGVFKTTDGGKNWRKVLYINDLTGCAELVVDPRNPDKLIAAMWEYERKPYHFTSGGKGSGIHVSYDGGETWTKRTDEDGLPKGDLGRCGLAISAANPDVVYALIEAKENALYKSTDGGRKWKKMADKNQGNRPFYYAEIYADPMDENTVYSIHTTITKSIDGGSTFETFAGWDIHVDHHALFIHPRNPDFIVNGNDGGMNITQDGGETWRFVENLPVGQFYHINIDNELPYNVYGGMQDNGSWVGPSNVWRSGGILNTDFQEVLFGDGFDVMPVPDETRYLYAMYQGGNLYYVDKLTGLNYYIRPSQPEDVRYNWNAGLAQDPFNKNGIYYGSQYLHYSSDRGQNWTVLSPDLTDNDTSKLHQDISGGLTIDATNAENYCTIVSIAPSPFDKNTIWIGTDDGNLQLTRDGGKTWQNQSGKLPNFPKNGWIPQITVSEKNDGEAFVVVNNYRQNDWSAYVYHTKNHGATWTRLADDRQIHTFCHSIIQDPVVENLLFLGTDGGLYFSLDYGRNWEKWDKEGFPSVPVSDLKIQKRDADLIIGTYGRALAVLDDLNILRDLANNKDLLKAELKVFNPDIAYLAEYQSHAGSHFPADAHFEGEGRSPRGNILIYTSKKVEKGEEVEKDKKGKKEKKENDEKEDKVDKKDKKKGDKKLRVYILDNQGDTLRTLTPKVDSGFVRTMWRLDTRGEHLPSKESPKEDDEPWGGPSVLPGTYKVLAVQGDLRDSTTIEVKDDPRLNRSTADLQGRADALNRLNATIKKATEGYNRLKKAEKTIKRINETYDLVADSTKKSFVDLGKTMQDSITEMKGFFFEHEEQKGIQRNPKHLNARFWQAREYINSSPAAPASNASAPFEVAERETAAILGRIERFFEEDWVKYKEAVKAVEFELFEE